MIRWFFRILALLILLYAGGYALFSVTLPRPASDERTDAIVVLTGGTGRLERGFALMEQGLAQRMLISGVPRTARPEDYIGRHDVDPRQFECCIALDRESFDTRSNAEEIARWLERRRYRSVRLVTNDFHMCRAHYELARRLGAGVTILDDAVPTSANFRRTFEEYNKLLFAWAAGLIGI